ncbi:pilus assembly protein [Dokdonella sp.]|uniref:pilus assembly protein n=1 Tax=Dokdonella sp. TaxID=2291710 RepID=UPI003784F017
MQAKSRRFLALAALGCGICLLGSMSTDLNAQSVIAPGTIDLVATPPELTTSVNPNIVVTFDDSGSMASNFMGDNRPFDGGSWTGPWRCAGVIDPRATSGIGTRAMNGVYYNPNVLYTPPIRADGTQFPNADATLASVWADGIAVNRPLAPVTPAAPAYNNNMNDSGNGNDNRRTIINGIKSGTTDRRWQCGYGTYPTAFAGGENINNGGPYYFRLKTGLTIPLDAFGDPTGPSGTAGTGQNVLYNVANWEAVVVPNAAATIEGVSVNQWQNFANWYAYYRTRNIMTRSALSRTFAKFSGNVRVAWQNINNGTYKLPAAAIITQLLDKAGVACSTISPSFSFGAGSQPDCYRSAFFNWVFQVGASGNTPDRESTIRAGEFFTRGNSSDLKDPYWQLADPSVGASARELSCRQNFHMLVTDGYWNEGNPTAPGGFFGVQGAPTLPDGVAFTHDTPSRAFWDVPVSPTGTCGATGSTDCYPSLADIGFYYWAKDLRTDLANKVRPYVPDKTTGVTGSVPLGVDPLANREIYFNPANDPASWQHVVQFMVTLGIAGQLNYANDPDCANPNSDLCKLRKGQTNSSGAIGWPIPARNDPRAIDDTWHAAVNSRGSYFSASNPGDLVTHLEAIINSVLSRGASSTPVTLSLPLATAGNAAYAAGYDSTDWSGSLVREDVDPVTNAVGALAPWDAGCLLTGGTFDKALRKCTPPSGGPWVAPPGYPSTARNPDSRRIFTSKRDALGNTTGVPFRWDTAALGTELVDGLNQKPTNATLCNAATNAVACDAFGANRVDYIRGVRMNEATASPRFRTRSSVLGAIVNASPRYVSSPRSDYHDAYPIGTPEQVAYRANHANGYATYQYGNRSRKPMVYVGSNDGMLHAFDASTGVESWAYVPSTLIQNRRLARSTADTAGLTPGVDAQPIENDVFINGAWRTYIIGSLRLGGRGIYALDVTDIASSGDSESAVASRIKWEFNSGPTRAPASVPSPDPVCAAGATSCPSLGYTYGSGNVARIRAGNRWVAVVSSGYFPSLSGDAANPDDANEPAAKHTSLLVIDLATGKLVREIRTDIAPQVRPAGFKTYGLSTPVVVSSGAQFQIDDFVYAGDLAGNLWRFDLSDANPLSWKVDLMFTTYGDGGAANAGDQPIVFNPTKLLDPVTRRPVIIVGTGKYLGRDDRTSAIPQQAFYGIRDYAGSASYPVRVNQLLTQKMTQGATSPLGIAQRQNTGFDPPATTMTAATPFMIVKSFDAGGNPVRTRVRANGWRLPLNIPGEPGERAERRPVPLYAPNVAILYTMIPKGDDPCDPGRRFALMFVDGGSGGSISLTGAIGPVVGSDAPLPEIQAGPEGEPRLPPGGGNLPVGMLAALNQAVQAASPFMPWHRGAWKELLDLQ